MLKEEFHLLQGLGKCLVAGSLDDIATAVQLWHVSISCGLSVVLSTTTGIRRSCSSCLIRRKTAIPSP